MRKDSKWPQPTIFFSELKDIGGGGGGGEGVGGNHIQFQKFNSRTLYFSQLEQV